MEVWGFLWLMVLLKIPVAALLWIVWWAVRSTPEPEAEGGDEDGGIGTPDHRLPLHPRGPRRRGPHGDPTAPPPPRTRTPARSRERASR